MPELNLRHRSLQRVFAGGVGGHPGFVTEAGDGVDFDNADWGGPSLTCTS